MKFSEYTTKDQSTVLNLLASSENGLSDVEAKERIKKYGFNEVKIKETTLFDVFLRQFKSPFFYLLTISGILAFFIGEKVDCIVIFMFILINIFLGFFQEGRAHHTISLLRKYFPERIRVLRDGVEKLIDKKFLVPGDIALLEIGTIVPADIRILKTQNLLIDESVLSGESAPVVKISSPLSEEAKEIFEARNIVFNGTSVVSGKAEGIVIGTGRNSFFGEIMNVVSGIKRESAYEKELLSFSQLILKIVIAAIMFIFIGRLLIKGTSNIFDFVIFSVALIVSIIPEALPIIVTFAMSEGALKMAKENVVVKRLSAIEDLGNIEILCSDKTGTLTENKLKLEKVYAKDRNKFLLYSLLTSSFTKEEINTSLSPFDIALFEQASDEIKQSIKGFREISDIPFDSHRLRNSALLENSNGELVLTVKGAPEVILGLCSDVEIGLSKEEVSQMIRTEGLKGRRTLGVAYKKTTQRSYSETDERDFSFIGFSSFIDPIKPSAKESIRLAQKLGVKIKILTGDSKEVAGSVAEEVGLIKNLEEVVMGKEIDSLPEEEFDKKCEDYSVFARVSPETKLKIIKSLQKKFEVGFLGEGINDTPALQAANVGIVVKEAADVPRESADIILLEKNLKVLVDGIKQGRTMFSNINKYIRCALASNFGNFYSIAVISLFIDFLPMLPIQILLGNLLSDFPLISIATDHVDVEELKKPKFYKINQSVWIIICLALVSTVFDFIFFGIFFKSQPAVMQTLWFIESILTEIALIFIIRSRHFFLKAKRPSLPLLFFTIFDAAIITLLPFSKFGQDFFHFITPPIQSLLLVFFLVFNYFIVSEIVKLMYFRFAKAEQRRNGNK